MYVDSQVLREVRERNETWRARGQFVLRMLYLHGLWLDSQLPSKSPRRLSPQMKYLILGNGWLGSKFDKALENPVLWTTRIENSADIKKAISIHQPDVVLNCIGKTGRPNIDWCEDHKEETFFSNVTVPHLIAEVCEEYGLYMVHLGSGCVYQGTYGDDYTEKDPPNFIDSYYSKTKVMAEDILKHYERVLIARLRMPFDHTPDPRNLINKLTNYKQVLGDVPNSMTYVPDLIWAVNGLAEARETGIYNIVNEGAITHREILTLYQKVVDPTFKLPEFIDLATLKTLIKAPRSNCVLSERKLAWSGFHLQHITEAMDHCMREMKARSAYQ